jgi:hypothetical protein
VSSAARVLAKVLVLEAVGVRDVAEGGARKEEAALVNSGTKMG